MTPKTCETSPLRIDIVPYPGNGAGIIGMTPCPGKHQPDAQTGSWRRDLSADIEVIRDWGAAMVVTLMEEHELQRYEVSDLPDAVLDAGLDWLHLPIPDRHAPDETFARTWAREGTRLHERLGKGEWILVHCRAGLGRTGTIAAQLLIERGLSCNEAIRQVRTARPGAVEDPRQERYLQTLAKARQ